MIRPSRAILVAAVLSYEISSHARVCASPREESEGAGPLVHSLSFWGHHGERGDRGRQICVRPVGGGNGCEM